MALWLLLDIRYCGWVQRAVLKGSGKERDAAFGVPGWYLQLVWDVSLYSSSLLESQKYAEADPHYVKNLGAFSNRYNEAIERSRDVPAVDFILDLSKRRR